MSGLCQNILELYQNISKLINQNIHKATQNSLEEPDELSGWHFRRVCSKMVCNNFDLYMNG